MKEKVATKTPRMGLTSEVKRRKRMICLWISSVTVITVLFFLFRRKNKFLMTPRETIIFGTLKDILDQIDIEVDECLMHKTRKEQNAAFSNIKSIEGLVPIRMSEMTAVFKYHGDISDVLVANGVSWAPDKIPPVIVKRVIVKRENHPEEEEISTIVNSKYLMKTYLTHTTDFVSTRGVEQRILWLFMEVLEYKLTSKEIDRDEAKIRSILRDTIEGLKYLHAHGIAHLDLKLANVMGESSQEDGKVLYKLIDFGFSRQMPPGEKEKIFPERSYGTFPYKPPEVWKKQIHGLASDIWCLGTMALFMANKDTSFFQKKDVKKGGNSKDYHKFRKFIDGELHIPINQGASPELADFILKCMNRSRDARPTAKELASHPFILGTHLSLEEAKAVYSHYFV